MSNDADGAQAPGTAPSGDRVAVRRRSPGYRFLLVTTLKPHQVAMALLDNLGVPSVSTAVRCVDGSAAVKTRFEFVYPTGPLSSRLHVVVDGRAVPSVAGSNVHLVVRPIRSLAAHQRSRRGDVARRHSSLAHHERNRHRPSGGVDGPRRQRRSHARMRRSREGDLASGVARLAGMRGAQPSA